MATEAIEVDGSRPATKDEHTGPANAIDMEQSGGLSTPLEAETPQTSNWKKPYQFYLASLSLWLAVLIVSLDSTGLAVAIPVCIAPAVVQAYGG